MTITRRFLFVLVAWAIVAALWPSQLSSQSPPAPGQDSTAVHRIVSLVPAVTEMLFAIGAGYEVVGVSSFDHYPPEVETRTRVGALVDPDFERIVSLRPDLVVVYGTQNDLIARLGRVHLPVFRYQHAGLADVTQTMRVLGARIGLSASADVRARRIENQLASIRNESRSQPHPRTALIIGRDPGALRGIFASGGIGFMHDMLEVAGGADAFGDVKRENVQASAEMLIARAPEVILELRPDEHWNADRIQSEVNLWKQLTSLPAVRADRVHILTDDKLLVPGPRVAEAVALMARAIH